MGSSPSALNTSTSSQVGSSRRRSTASATHSAIRSTPSTADSTIVSATPISASGQARSARRRTPISIAPFEMPLAMMEPQKADKKRYVSSHIYTVTWLDYMNAIAFQNTPTRAHQLPRNPEIENPNHFLRGRPLYDALIDAGVRVKWESIDRSPPAFRHSPWADGIGRTYTFLWGNKIHENPGTGLTGKRDKQEEEESSDDPDYDSYFVAQGSDEEYDGRVKLPPETKRKRRLSNTPCLAANRRPRSEKMRTLKNSKGNRLTEGAQRNAERLKNDAKPRGRPKKIKIDLDLNDADNESSVTRIVRDISQNPAGERFIPRRISSSPNPMPGKAIATIPRLVGATQEAFVGMDTLAVLPTGLQRNEHREAIGKKKRGRPVGVKNKPKTAPDVKKTDSVIGEHIGGSSSRAQQESAQVNGTWVESAHEEHVGGSFRTEEERTGAGREDGTTIAVSQPTKACWDA